MDSSSSSHSLIRRLPNGLFGMRAFRALLQHNIVGVGMDGRCSYWWVGVWALLIERWWHCIEIMALYREGGKMIEHCFWIRCMGENVNFISQKLARLFYMVIICTRHLFNSLIVFVLMSSALGV